MFRLKSNLIRRVRNAHVRCISTSGIVNSARSMEEVGILQLSIKSKRTSYEHNCIHYEYAYFKDYDADVYMYTSIYIYVFIYIYIYVYMHINTAT
jgi:hypothetical protein